MPIRRTRQVIVSVAMGRLTTCSVKLKDCSSVVSGGWKRCRCVKNAAILIMCQ
jgi:hypothetical protein